MRALARRYKLVARPRTDRWHKKPTALYGGIGIYLAFLLSHFWLQPKHVSGENLLVLCGSGMFLLGLVDDAVQLKPYAKLVGQIVFATVFTTFGMRLHWLPAWVPDQALTIFWLVGITNAVNLLDSLDGVAGGVATIASGFMVYFCHAAGQDSMAMLAAAFCGANLGFLVFNFNPASIFMGDCGSLFLGFFLGGAALVTNQTAMRRDMVSILAIPVLLLLLPIIDTTLVTIARLLARRPVSQGGRDHTAHRLVALGMSERAAALTLYGFAILSGAVAILVRNVQGRVGAFIAPAFGMVIVFLVVFIGKTRVYEPVSQADEQKMGGRALVPTLADFSYKRRVFEVLNDLAICLLAYYGAILLRFDGDIPIRYYQSAIRMMPVVIVAQLASFLALGLYRGLWRYTSMADVATLIRAVGGGWVASVVALVFVARYENMSRGMFVMDGVLLLGGVIGSRLSFRLLRTWMARFQPKAEAKRVLIYGAGDGGELLLREMQNNMELGLDAVGFVDDDPQKHGRVIHGVRVLGSIERLGELAGAEKAEAVVISTARLTVDNSVLVNQKCREAGLACRRMRIALD